jgi:hypothetical protein
LREIKSKGGEMSNWTDKLTDDERDIMKALSGFADDITSLMDIMTKNMDKKTNRTCRLGYISMLAHSLGVQENA